MKKNEQGPGFIVKVATWIVDKRNLFFLIYAAAIVFSVFSRNWVDVNNELTDYLDEATETKQGLSIMEDSFRTFGTARVMVSNITYDKALELTDTLKEIKGVSSVDMGEEDDAEDRDKHYRNSAALYDITFDGEADEQVSTDAMEELKNTLAQYDVSISSTVGQDESVTLANEINFIMKIVAVIIVAVLLLATTSYGEVPVLIITFVAAMILSMGTHFILGEISFVSNSVSSILQLALAIDYAIILCHRFSEERENENAREACILALSKAIPEISSSCLTTLSGLAAMMFMQFKIGFDMGVVLIKAVLLSILTVFTLMPGLLMLFSDIIDRTKHKNFIPKITAWGRFVTRFKYVVPPLFLLLVIGSAVVSQHCPYGYGKTLIETEKKNDAKIQQEAVEGRFGTQNTAAIIVPAGDYETEGKLLKEIESMEEIDTATGLANVAVEDYVLTDKLTPRQFAEFLDMDIELIRVLYTAYAADQEAYGRVVGGIDSYSVSILDMFLFVYDCVQDGYVTLDEELEADLDDLYEQITKAKEQLQSEEYSRMVVTLALPEEGDETFAFLDRLHNTIGKYYEPGTFYVAGESTNDYDLAASFVNDNVLISVLSIVFVIIVLLFTFQSVGLPVLLIIVIQGSIWINFAVPAVTGTYVFFLSYLVVSSIQMGANIDYAIVISSRYQELKKEMQPRDAMIETLNLAFPTILTSGSILACAGILIGKLTSDTSIYGVGSCLGRGTIISIILVLGVLPEILLLGDTIIERTAFNIKYPALVQNVSAEGKVHLDGWVKGEISGKIDAEVHGVLEGDVTAQVHVRRTSPIKEEEPDDDAKE